MRLVAPPAAVKIAQLALRPLEGALKSVALKLPPLAPTPADASPCQSAGLRSLAIPRRASHKAQHAFVESLADRLAPAPRTAYHLAALPHAAQTICQRLAQTLLQLCKLTRCRAEGNGCYRE